MPGHDKCPLPTDGKFLHESDISDECKECLGILFEGEPYAEYFPRVGADHEIDPKACMGAGCNCEADAYYWSVSLARREGGYRAIEISAECDDCGNFALTSLKTVCRNSIDTA